VVKTYDVVVDCRAHRDRYALHIHGRFQESPRGLVRERAQTLLERGHRPRTLVGPEATAAEGYEPKAIERVLTVQLYPPPPAVTPRPSPSPGRSVFR
jgi:hypothetical protein